MRVVRMSIKQQREAGAMPSQCNTGAPPYGRLYGRTAAWAALQGDALPALPGEAS